MPLILPGRETEIEVWSQSGQIAWKTSISKITRAKMDWRCGSRGSAPALQVWSWVQIPLPAKNILKDWIEGLRRFIENRKLFRKENVYWILNCHLLLLLFPFLFWWDWGLNWRLHNLQSRHSTVWATPLVHFCCDYFEDGVWPTICPDRLQTVILNLKLPSS
jgi:hypothetical protein